MTAQLSGLHGRGGWGCRPYMYKACGPAYIVAMDRALLSMRLQHLRLSLCCPCPLYRTRAETCGRRARSGQRAVGRAALGTLSRGISGRFLPGLAGPHQGASRQETGDRRRWPGINRHALVEEGSGTKEPAGGHAVVLGRENYGQVKWCLSEQPFFSPLLLWRTQAD